MYSKLPIRIFALLFLLIIISPLSACNVNGTKIEFSFNTSSPSNSSNEKTIYIKNDMDKLELNFELKIDSGNAIIQVLNASNNEVLWNNSYQEDSKFKIELNDIKADSEYLFKIETTQSKKVKLIITSNSKLVRDKEKPGKYIIEKK